MKRRPSWTGKQRAEIFRDAKGVCYLCSRKIAEGEEWQVEHPKARGLGGSDKQEDMRPAHVDCHKPKTKADNKIMRKADRQMKAHFGTQAAPKAQIRSAPFFKATKPKGNDAHIAAMAKLGKRIVPRRTA